MRRIWLSLVAAGLGLLPAIATAQDLRKPAGKEWLTIGGDWNNTRYSTLTQINRSNVKNLKGAWVMHLGSGLGQKYSLEGTPIVKDGVMYIATGNDDVFALDAQDRRADLGAPLRHRAEHQHGVLRLGQSRRRGRRRARSSSASSTAPSSRSTPRPASRCGRRRSATGRTATPSPPRRSTTTAWSTPAFPAATAQARGFLDGARRQDRQGDVALLDRAGAGRVRLATPGRRRTIPIRSKPRPGPARRRHYLADAGDRSRTRPDLFLHRQPRPGVRRHRRQPAGRQPVQLVDRGAARWTANTRGTSSRCTTTCGTSTARARWCCSTRCTTARCARASPRPARPAGSTSSTAPTESR